MVPFKYFHFSCTGALAIEAAVKTVIDYRDAKDSVVITFKESFHGINGYGVVLTDRFGSVRSCLTLLYASLVTASKRWRGVTMTPAVLKQLQQLRAEIATSCSAEEVVA